MRDDEPDTTSGVSCSIRVSLLLVVICLITCFTLLLLCLLFFHTYVHCLISSRSDRHQTTVYPWVCIYIYIVLVGETFPCGLISPIRRLGYLHLLLWREVTLFKI